MEVVVLEELERSGKFDPVARVVVEYGLRATPAPDAVSSLLALFERNGFRYAIDARSGRPIDAFQSVTVRAWRCGPSFLRDRGSPATRRRSYEAYGGKTHSAARSPLAGPSARTYADAEKRVRLVLLHNHSLNSDAPKSGHP